MKHFGGYILLPDGSVKMEPDPTKWGQYFEEHDRRIALDVVNGYRVSTVFLGLDHNFGSGGPPILFETMVFSEKVESFKVLGKKREYHPSLDQYTERYHTLYQAKKGHQKTVEKIKEVMSGASET